MERKRGKVVKREESWEREGKKRKQEEKGRRQRSAGVDGGK